MRKIAGAESYLSVSATRIDVGIFTCPTSLDFGRKILLAALDDKFLAASPRDTPQIAPIAGHIHIEIGLVNNVYLAIDIPRINMLVLTMAVATVMRIGRDFANRAQRQNGTGYTAQQQTTKQLALHAPHPRIRS